MIIVEERLNEAFSQLPEIDGFKPVYDWGNEFNLIATLKRYSDEKKSPYPLIYQVSQDDEQKELANETETSLVLYLAVQNLQTELVNKERWAMSYENILFPLAENIIKTFRRAQIFTWNVEYTLRKRPNFGKETANFTTDIWDVLIFETRININANCINEFNYN